MASPSSALKDPSISSSQNPDASKIENQWEELKKLYTLLPNNKLDDLVLKLLRQVVENLQVNTISQLLQGAYLPKELEEFKTSAQEEFEKIGLINQERMENLVDLSTPEMKKVILESLFLFDVNPAQSSPLIINEQIGFDEDGDPLYQTHSYPVFQENALSGIDGAKRFLPDKLIVGEDDDQLGIDLFLRKEYSSLSTDFDNSETENGSPPAIKAITTIGSLGGIGHKSDSDMDIQIVFDTSPQIKGDWNDGDFFIVFLKRIFHLTHQYFFDSVLSEEVQEALQRKVEEEIIEKYGDALTEEEKTLIPLIAPSKFQVELHKKIWSQFVKLPENKQAAIIWKQISFVTCENPYFEIYSKHLRKFFSFIQIRSETKFESDWFPFSLGQLSSKKRSNKKLWGWVIDYYKENYLSRIDIQQILRRYSKQKSLDVNTLTVELQQKAILEHLQSINQRAPVIKSFLNDLMGKISLESQQLMAPILRAIIDQFDSERKFLVADFLETLPKLNRHGFLNQMVGLIDFYIQEESIEQEANCEIAIKKKVFHAENYLSKKYPDVEIHIFTNILRNQRVGKHTPFLVSPEGSLAYDLMLNDSLLNPGIYLCGKAPIPFTVPHAIKALCYTGVFPENEWVLTQGKEGEVQEFSMRSLPDWGELNITRQKFLEHALPIFFRESEKISHRNLPKALLNCWWIEMICCLDDEKKESTSLTKLLFNPDSRYFLKHNLTGKHVRSIKMMEKEFPQLIRDPWWIKFSEMLLRFEDKEIQEQIIFCFSQHIRLSDIIDFNNQARPIWLDDNVSWRIKSLVSFYNYFYEKEESRIDQMRFSQGYDDIVNKVEKNLKLAFLKSMKTVEKQLNHVGSTKALKLLMGYILKIGGDIIGPKANQIAIHTLEQIHILNETFVVIEEGIVQKVKDQLDLNNIEKLQWQQYQADRKRLKEVVRGLIEYYEQFGLTPSPATIEKLILSSRIQLGGDPLENVIFKYHFERNFKRKPNQIPLPISKSLSIPRKRISIALDPRSQKWVFKAILSKKDLIGPHSRYANQSDNEIEMFTAPLVEGIVRCVVSGYIGFSTKNLTAIEKPAVRATMGTNITNPVTNQDVQILATEMHEFFSNFSIRPRELLNNVHYIREVYMICNINRFNQITLVVRDNLGDFFVIGFDVSRIKVTVRPSQMKIDFNLSRFFLQFNTKECRYLFMKALNSLNIPLLSEYLPKFNIWINTGNFNYLIRPKHHRTYLDGIVKALWNTDLIGTSEFLHSVKLKHNFDFYGKEAIEKSNVAFHNIDASQKQPQQEQFV